MLRLPTRPSARGLTGLCAALLVCLGLALPAAAQRSAEDATPFPFKEGDTVTFDQIEKLKPFLPEQFWEHREYFFFEGMELQIGPTQRPYEGNEVYEAATKKVQGTASVGKDQSLVGYVNGRPFITNDIDCKNDPQAGAKVIWNFQKTWNGDGAKAVWSYTYWDRGDQLPLYYEGAAKFILMKHRIEPQYEEDNWDIFKNEKRLRIDGLEVLAPFDARGIMLLTYRYESSDYELAKAKNTDTWVYVPDLRRVRRLSTAQRSDSVQGTDFTLDDLRTFDGIPPQYEWTCLDRRWIVAPMNTKKLAYPYRDDYNFGPYGMSYANDNWELRDTWVVRMVPRKDDHPYHHKDLYLDAETYEPLYSFAYDRREELWKIIWHNKRYSEDWKTNDPEAPNGEWYPRWEGMDADVKDLRLCSDMIVNVQTGTGNRIEFWDVTGVPLESKGKIRRYIDIGRLNKGR